MRVSLFQRRIEPFPCSLRCYAANLLTESLTCLSRHADYLSDVKEEEEKERRLQTITLEEDGEKRWLSLLLEGRERERMET